ncbi:MAG: transposase [Chloroflexota bacterium]
MRGKKGVEHFDPLDPPRRRANKRRGRGTFANDRPPVLGTIGRSSGQVRLRVVKDTKAVTLRQHVERFTGEGTHIYTDEYDSYNSIDRRRSTVAHGIHEWARDDDGDGIREVHTNTIEGLWAGLRTFLRPFRGVSKHFLSGYVAIHEFAVNLKRLSVGFITALVRLHSFYR